MQVGVADYSHCQITACSKLCSSPGVLVFQKWPNEANSLWATLVTGSAMLTVQDALLTYKALNNMAPEYITELVTEYTPGRTLRSLSQHLLRIPSTGWTNFYSNRTFSIAAPKIWNNLPSHIRAMTSLSQFKKHLKTHIFKSVNGVL